MQFDQLSIEVAGHVVVQNLSLAIKPGELHYLLGPNGAGKSSLGLAVAGHPNYKVVSGRITIDGQDVTALNPSQRSQLGFFLQFQAPVEVPGVSINHFLRQVYLNRQAGTAKKTMTAGEFFSYLIELATQVDLKPSILTRGLNEGFSGGEKKRLEMLQLLVLEPRYVILDELDSGLDVDALKLLSKTILLIQKKHHTGILLITHTSKITRHLKPDYVHIMVDGQIIKSGGYQLVDQIEQSGYR